MPALRARPDVLPWPGVAVSFFSRWSHMLSEGSELCSQARGPECRRRDLHRRCRRRFGV